MFFNNFEFFKINSPLIIFYSITFVSYIAPVFFFNLNKLTFVSLKKKKILFKQSYIIFSWLYYLSFVKIKKKNITFFVFPIKKKTFTLVKSPMAHKNWSKEQYKIQYFLFKINYKNTLNSFFQLNLNQILLIYLLTKKNFLNYETNVLFLKNYQLFISFFNSQYFNYNKILFKK